ncbi:MAG: hypothetical protein U9N59_16455 [Campylobacterota bacterium]|nr:hypothetical protein [Campylobacterota bacterium]
MQEIQYSVILNNNIKINTEQEEKLSKIEVEFPRTKMPFSDIEIDIYLFLASKKECEEYISKQDEDIRELFIIEQSGQSIQYTAFIDILGFSDYIKDNIKNDYIAEDFYKNLKSITEYLKFEKNRKDNIEGGEYLDDITMKYTWVSDTFVITMCYEQEIGDNINIVKSTMILKLSMMISSISHFVANKYEFLIRGAISSKYSCITDNLILGEGISEAATLEKNVAIYPRVIFEQSIISDEMYEKISRHYRDNNLNYISKDCDGYYFINYLAMLQYIPPMIGKTLKVSTERLKDLAMKNIKSTLIQYDKIAIKNIEKYKYNSKIALKYIWFKKYLEDVNSSENFQKNIIENLKLQ